MAPPNIVLLYPSIFHQEEFLKDGTLYYPIASAWITNKTAKLAFLFRPLLSHFDVVILRPRHLDARKSSPNSEGFLYSNLFQKLTVILRVRRIHQQDLIDDLYCFFFLPALQ